MLGADASRCGGWVACTVSVIGRRGVIHNHPNHHHVLVEHASRHNGKLLIWEYYGTVKQT